MVTPHKPEHHSPVPEVRERAVERVDEHADEAAAEALALEARRRDFFRRREFHEHFERERETRTIREITEERGGRFSERFDEHADARVAEAADAAADAAVDERA